MKTKTLNAYSDPGHGWVKAPKSLLKELGIADKISTCSYQCGDFAYLEEDCDATLLVKTAKTAGIELKFRHSSADKQSKIRGYETYCAPKEA